MTNPVCSKCQKPLTDPLSIAVGMGPECREGGGGQRKKMTRGQIRKLSCIQRAESYSKHEPIPLGDVTYRREEEGWTRDGKYFSTDEDFKSWLQRYGIADFKSLEIIQANREEV